MENLSSYIYGGIIGAIISIVINFVITYRYSKQKDKLKKESTAQEREYKLWKSMHLGVRQGITNEYIFSVLMYLFIGNIIWIGTEIISPLIGSSSHEFYLLLNSFGLAIGVVFFLLGFGRIKRYIKLRALDNDEDFEKIVKE